MTLSEIELKQDLATNQFISYNPLEINYLIIHKSHDLFNNLYELFK